MRNLETLPNGANILLINHEKGIVLAAQNKQPGTEFITWAFHPGDLKSTHTGWYTFDIDTANADFIKRVKRGY